MHDSPDTQTAPAEHPLVHLHRGRLVRLCWKELRETLRDRRTIVTLVLMPLLVYPLLSIVFQNLLFTSAQQPGEEAWIIGVSSEADGLLVRHYLERGDRLLQKQSIRSGLADPAKARPRVHLEIRENPRRGVADGTIDLAVLVKPTPADDAADSAMRPLHCELVYRDNSPLSKEALFFVEDRLRAVNLDALGPQFELPTRAIRRRIEGAGFSLTTLVPLILVLMTITGAVYPAIDLTAGERERGTMELLMAAPVPRLGLLLAKYVAVVTVALLTATANLLAMTVTLLSSGLGALVFGPDGLSLTLVIQVLALLILFAAFFSALLLAFTSFARSFKEAQAYLIPLMLLCLAPGIMSLMPGLKFSGLLAVTPLVNIVLLARDMLEGIVEPLPAAIAVLSTALYTVATIAIAARIFGADAIVCGSEAGWSDLWRRPVEPRPAASLPGALLCLALTFPCYVLLSSLLARTSQWSLSGRLLAGALATGLLFAGLPLVAAAWQRVRIVSAFQLRPARWTAYPIALLLGVSLWPLAHEIVLWTESMLFSSLSEEKIEAVNQLLAQWRNCNLLLILFSLGLAPGVCEELFFRGYLFTALRRATTPRNTLLLSSVLFGAFHVVSTSLLAPERFLPSTFLGLVLGWLCWRTGSVLPGILLHVSHNSLLLMMAYFRDELTGRGWGLEQRSHLPLSWLATSLAVTAVCLLLLSLSQQRLGSRTTNEHGSYGPVR